MRELARGTLHGVFLRPGATLRAWRDADPPARWTLTRITLPFLLASVVLAGIGHDLSPTDFPPQTRPDPLAFGIYSALTQLVGVLALAAGAHYLCDLFQGRSYFERAIAAVTVALVPAWTGNVVAALPWPYGAYGALLLIGYSLVLLYAAFAIVLGVRKGNRLGHFAAVLAAAALMTFAFGWQAVSLIPGAAPEVRLGTTWLI